MKIAELIDAHTQQHLQQLVKKKRKRKRRNKRKTTASVATPAVTVKHAKTYSTKEIESLMGVNRYIPGRKSLLK